MLTYHSILVQSGSAEIPCIMTKKFFLFFVFYLFCFVEDNVAEVLGQF